VGRSKSNKIPCSIILVSEYIQLYNDNDFPSPSPISCEMLACDGACEAIRELASMTRFK
jgi:hypothetical protein